MVPTRRHFLRSAGLASVAAVTGGRPSAGALAVQSSVGHHVQTDTLDISYEESGDGAAFPILLLHGFPYDVRAWDGAVPPLVEAGYRVVVPYLRGYGPTRFLDPSAPRMAEQAAIAQDVVDFADALGLEQFALAGFDWGIARPASRRFSVRNAYAHRSRLAGTRSRIRCLRRRLRRRSSKRGSGISGISTPSVGEQGSRRTDGGSAATSGRRGRPAGSSATRPMTVRRLVSTTPISSMSWFIPIGTVTATRLEKSASWRWSVSWRTVLRFRCPRSCCAGRRVGLVDRPRIRRETRSDSRPWSPVASSTAPDTICQLSGQTPWSRRCSSCWPDVAAPTVLSAA